MRARGSQHSCRSAPRSGAERESRTGLPDVERCCCAGELSFDARWHDRGVSTADACIVNTRPSTRRRADCCPPPDRSIADGVAEPSACSGWAATRVRYLACQLRRLLSSTLAIHCGLESCDLLQHKERPCGSMPAVQIRGISPSREAPIASIPQGVRSVFREWSDEFAETVWPRFQVLVFAAIVCVGR